MDEKKPTETANQLVERLRKKYAKELAILEEADFVGIPSWVNRLENVMENLDSRGIEVSIENITNTFEEINHKKILKDLNYQLEEYVKKKEIH